MLAYCGSLSSRTERRCCRDEREREVVKKAEEEEEGKGKEGKTYWGGRNSRNWRMGGSNAWRLGMKSLLTPGTRTLRTSTVGLDSLTPLWLVVSPLSTRSTKTLSSAQQEISSISLRSTSMENVSSTC
ncbi:hypothetical protein CsSME_00004980 [Camellia sinensis var. sinensis]